MKIKPRYIISLLLVTSSTAFALHDITVANNTDSYITGKTKTSPCSSVVGDKGIFKPHSVATVYQIVEDLYCSHSCDGEVYASKNCTGSKIATVTLDPHTGLKNLRILDNHYRVVGDNYNVALENTASEKKGLFSFLFG